MEEARPRVMKFDLEKELERSRQIVLELEEQRKAKREDQYIRQQGGGANPSGSSDLFSRRFEDSNEFYQCWRKSRWN
jgi:hypothetical protein